MGEHGLSGRYQGQTPFVNQHLRADVPAPIIIPIHCFPLHSVADVTEFCFLNCFLVPFEKKNYSPHSPD
jgi:hypothetical protein